MWRPRSSKTGRLLEDRVVVSEQAAEIETFRLERVGSGIKGVDSLRRARVLKKI